MGKLTEETVMRKGRMGDAFIRAKKLTAEQVNNVVRIQNERGLLFGEAAVKLGYLSSAEIEDVLEKQFNFNSPLGRRGTQIASSLAIVHSPYSEEAEGIRRLRSQIVSKVGEGQQIALTILSPLKREGKSHVAASLAVAFAQLNIPTMLIDANLRAPTLHKLFGIPNQTGLSTMLARRSPKTIDQTHPVMPNLWVLSSGPPPPNPLEILSPPNFSSLLARFSSEINVFIIDTPAATIWADGETIARQTGFALMVGSFVKNMSTIGSVWMRFIYPIWFLGGFQFSWTVLFKTSPKLAYLNLINPMTYIMEAIRGAILGQEGYLPFWPCTSMVILFAFACAWYGIVRLKKRLDFV